MKKFIAGVIIGVIISLTISSFAKSSKDLVKDAYYADDVKIKVDGTYSQVKLINIEGSNYAKVRDLVRSLGGVTGWDTEHKTILVTSNKEVTPKDLENTEKSK